MLTKLTNEKHAEISGIVDNYRVKHGESSLPRQEDMWKYTSEVNEDCTPKVNLMAELEEGTRQVILFLRETKVSSVEFHMWAKDAFEVFALTQDTSWMPDVQMDGWG